MLKIAKMKESDVLQAARIASQCFSGMRDIKKARLWINCNLQAFPRARYFAAKDGQKIIGYILWLEKGGFRKEAVLELEQIAVQSASQGQGVATQMIKDSLASIKKDLARQGRRLKLVEATTGAGNKAQELYKKTLGAKPVAVVKNLFRGDEVIMISRQKQD